MKDRHIVALGGGGFLEEDGESLEDYILSLSSQRCPKICFLATATGDNENMIVKFYRRFTSANCKPVHLELFRRTVRDLGAFLKSQDIIFVGGGNSANMLAVWRLHGLDRAIQDSYDNGTILAGVSAGSICWFEFGITDSFGAELARLNCLGILKGSNCPHYDVESTRRPAYHRLIEEGLPSGIATDNGVALHFVNENLHKVVASNSKAKAYRVELQNGKIQESLITPELLIERTG